MREMLKRRQFIFGKQNINRHQPYAGDVVINVSDEGNSIPEAIMRFAPTKKEVVDIIKGDFDEDFVFDISEKDVEFVDTFLYQQDDCDHIGYMYKLTKGSVVMDGENSTDETNRRIMCAGPVLASDGKVAFVTTRESDASDFDYFDNVLGPISLPAPFSDPDLPNELYDGTLTIVTDFDPHDIGVSITELPDPSYIVNITTDVLPYIINHIHLMLPEQGGVPQE